MDNLFQKSFKGRIELIFGPMFSGKSTELLRRIRRFTIAKRRCLLIKYEHDVRYTIDKVSTHDLMVWTAVPCTSLESVKEISLGYDVIGIDEGQFFRDIVPFSESMSNLGKIVIVAGLDGTFQRKPFGPILELVPLAENITKLTAVCAVCQGDAAFTKRLGNETEIELIGGKDKYIAICRSCFHSPLSHLPITSSTTTTTTHPFVPVQECSTFASSCSLPSSMLCVTVSSQF